MIIGGGQTGIHIIQQLSLKLGENQKVVLIDNGDLGGSFLNNYETPRGILSKEASEYGSSLRIFKDYSETYTVLKRYRKTIQQKIHSTIQKKQHILGKKLSHISNLTIIHGTPSFSTKNLVEIAKNDGSKELIGFEYCVICTGKSSLIDPEIEGLSNISFLYQNSVFLLPRIPTSLAILRVTRENLEVAQIYANLGVKVDIYEPQTQDDIIKGLDKLGFEYLNKNFFSQQIQLHFQTTIARVSNLGNQINIIDTANRNYKASDLYLHIEKGFSPDSMSLNLLGINTSFKGIETDEWGRTKARNIWALGDCIEISNPLNKFNLIDGFIQYYEQYIRTNSLKGSYPKISSNIPIIKVKANYPLFQIGVSQLEATKIYGPTITSYTLSSSQFANSFAKIIYDSGSKNVYGVLVTGQLVPYLEEYLTMEFSHRVVFSDIKHNIEALDFE